MRRFLKILEKHCESPLDEVLTRLLASVKIHSMESKATNPICSRFQVNKCPFGDKCKYRYVKDLNFIIRDKKENK